LGFQFSLPADWVGYTVINEKETYTSLSNTNFDSSAVKFSIKIDPQTNSNDDSYSFSIQAYTQDQWKKMQADTRSALEKDLANGIQPAAARQATIDEINAKTVWGLKVIASNSKYVFVSSGNLNGQSYVGEEYSQKAKEATTGARYF